MATTLDPTTLTAEQQKAVAGTQAFGTTATAAPAAGATGLLPAGYSASTGTTQGFDWTPQDDRVDTEVGRITAKESALTQQATTRALTGANRRGLLNTSMAVGAAEDSVLAAAMPMASQNAQQTYAKNLSVQNATQDRQAQAAQAELEKGLIQTRTEAESRLQGEKSRLDLATQSQLQAEKALQASQLADQEYRQQKGLQELDRASKEKIAAMNVAAEDKTRAMAAVSAAEGTYNEAFKQIAANNDMPAATRTAYLEHIARLRDTSLKMVEQMYGIDLQWDAPVALGSTLAAIESGEAARQAAAIEAARADERRKLQQFAGYSPYPWMQWDMNGLSGGSNGGGAGDGGGNSAGGSTGGSEG